ncbi:MAG: hypothetical protein M0Z36_07755 [Thermaerobacter sp.]|nr:hypothetical protein [Thermaerobacter sp.]
MYILDTSAIRGVGRSQLENAVKHGICLAVCTTTCFELASHLTKGMGNDYVRARGNFLKCCIPCLLDDSAVRWADRAGVPERINPSRREDRDLLTQMLQVVSLAPSIDDLHACRLRYPDGVLCPLKDCGTVFGQLLQQEEEWYVARMERLLREATFCGPPDGPYTITKEVLLTNLEQAGRGSPPDTSISRCRALRRARKQVPYIGYMLHRLYEAKNKGGTIDENDYEDALICLAIDWDAGDVLVTSDKGTIRALQATARLLERDNCVMSTEQFVKQYG